MTRQSARRPAGTPTGGRFAASARTESAVALDARPEALPGDWDWRNQQATVEGRQFTFNDVYGGRLFHGSPHPIADGEVIEPGRAEANFEQSDTDAVSITSGADIARYWASQTGKPFYVYEVDPGDTPITVWRASLANRGSNWRLAEGRVRSARVLRRIDPDDAAQYETALMRGTDPFARTDAHQDLEAQS